MGLFVNNQKTCPVCNGPTPRIFPTQIEGMPICKECDSKIDLPNDIRNQLTLESFRQYLDFYDQNKALRDIFSESYRMDFADYNSVIVMDTANRLFRINGGNNSLVMEASHLKSFRILEDNVPLFEGEGDTLRCHSSKATEQIQNLMPQITQFHMQKEMFRQLEHMNREQEERDREKNGGKTGWSSYASPAPEFNAPLPFKYFYVELTLTHPYWSGFRGKMEAPDLDRSDPNISIYIDQYQRKEKRLHTLAGDLMALINPDAREVYDAVEKAPAAVPQKSIGDIASEIERYKTLLDSGILTEEEFTAKKRQLLGI